MKQDGKCRDETEIAPSLSWCGTNDFKKNIQVEVAIWMMMSEGDGQSNKRNGGCPDEVVATRSAKRTL